MKNYFFLLLLCISLNVFSQANDQIVEPVTETEKPVLTYADVEKKPDFPGGMVEFYRFVGKNFNLATQDVSGKIYLTFVIEPDGKLTSIRIVRNNLGVAMGNEAIRVMKISPKWIPGEINGEKVKVQYTIPISIN